MISFITSDIFILVLLFAYCILCACMLIHYIRLVHFILNIKKESKK